jgi:hypothetical protein
LRGINGRAIFPYPTKEKELRRVPSRNRATVALIQKRNRRASPSPDDAVLKSFVPIWH